MAERKRAVNFTACENTLLMDLVVQHREIVENKKTDAVTNKQKESAWIEIARAFNCRSGLAARSEKTLKLKYEGIKRQTKKKSAVNRQEIYKTGGGGPSQIPYTDDEEKVLAICTNIDGLESRNDSDFVIMNGGSLINSGTTLPNEILLETQYEIEAETPHQISVSNEDINEGPKNYGIESEKKTWQEWTPRALKTKVTPILRKKSSKNTVAAKFDELTETRIELIKLQLEASKSELKCKKEEHELRIQQMQEEHALRMMHLTNEEKRKEEIHHKNLMQ